MPTPCSSKVSGSTTVFSKGQSLKASSPIANLFLIHRHGSQPRTTTKSTVAEIIHFSRDYDILHPRATIKCLIAYPDQAFGQFHGWQLGTSCKRTIANTDYTFGQGQGIKRDTGLEGKILNLCNTVRQPHFFQRSAP